MNTGTQIRNLRIERGMSQMELARALKTSQAAITAWENGKRTPNLAAITRIAEFFRVPVSLFTAPDSAPDSDSVHSVSESIISNPKLRILFDRSKYLSEEDLDTVISVVNAISKERKDD